MSSVSLILRSTREAKGVSLEDVAQRTYIKLPYLVALEEGHIEDLLAPVFVHGYIRQYARLLGLNANELVSQYQQEVKRESPRLAPAPVLTTADGAARSVGEADAREASAKSLEPAHALAGGESLPGTQSNGHAAPPAADDPISTAEVTLVERTVPMERNAPASFSTADNGRPAAEVQTVADAQSEAQRIIADAQREAERMRVEAQKYAFQVLTDLETELGRSLSIIKNGRQFLQQQRRRHAGPDKN